MSACGSDNYGKQTITGLALARYGRIRKGEEKKTADKWKLVGDVLGLFRAITLLHLGQQYVVSHMAHMSSLTWPMALFKLVLSIA
jgi:hypothetical protein